MSSNVLLYSSHLITDEELAEVILQADGVLTPGSPAGYFGGLVLGEAYVWISRIPCYDGVFDSEGKPMNEEVYTLLEQAKVLLGGNFKPGFISHLGEQQVVSGWLSVLPIPVVSTGRASLIPMKQRDASFPARRSSSYTSKMVPLPGMDYKG